MRVKTKLEQALEADPLYRGAFNSPTLQTTLDAISEEICEKLSPADILAHTKAVYDETALPYMERVDHIQIIPELIDFMELPELPHGSRILDLGCGPLARDTFYFANESPSVRATVMMRRLGGVPLFMRRSAPKHAYRVTAVDGSPVVITMAQLNFIDAMTAVRYKGEITFTPEFLLSDMHNLSSLPCVYNGVWSCAALFTHTPRALVGTALQSVARVLLPGGIFGVSYPCGREGVSYDHLLASSTGRIKYFSRPRHGFIAQEAMAAGLDLIWELSGDRTEGGVLKKGFFITQFYRKHV